MVLYDIITSNATIGKIHATEYNIIRKLQLKGLLAYLWRKHPISILVIWNIAHTEGVSEELAKRYNSMEITSWFIVCAIKGRMAVPIKSTGVRDIRLSQAT